MSTEIDSRVSASLHPMNVEKIDGYDDDTAPVLGHVLTAFSEAYLGIGQVHTAREKAKTNPTWNESQQILATAELADKVYAKVARALDGSRINIERGIAHLEKELTQPVESRASHPIAQEIRAHIKALPSADRMTFIKRAIDAGDTEVPTAALGAPAFLSGIEPGMQASLVRLYREKAQPDMAKRLKAMHGARQLLEERSGLLHTELAKAVGLPPHKVKQLRDAKNAAERAFVLKDVA